MMNDIVISACFCCFIMNFPPPRFHSSLFLFFLYLFIYFWNRTHLDSLFSIVSQRIVELYLTLCFSNTFLPRDRTEDIRMTNIGTPSLHMQTAPISRFHLSVLKMHICRESRSLMSLLRQLRLSRLETKILLWMTQRRKKSLKNLERCRAVVILYHKLDGTTHIGIMLVCSVHHLITDSCC